MSAEYLKKPQILEGAFIEPRMGVTIIGVRTQGRSAIFTYKDGGTEYKK